MRPIYTAVAIILCTSILTACTDNSKSVPISSPEQMLPGSTPNPGIVTNAPPASITNIADLLPDPAGYDTMSDETLRQGAEAVATALTLKGVDPGKKAIFDLVTEFAKCYQTADAVTGRIYFDRETPYSLGIVGIIDKAAASDPNLLATCAGKAAFAAIIPLPDGHGKPIQPCVDFYEWTQDGRTYLIVYMGTTLDFCHDACSGLPQCTKY